jgi:hypothetical protein
MAADEILPTPSALSVAAVQTAHVSSPPSLAAPTLPPLSGGSVSTAATPGSCAPTPPNTATALPYKSSWTPPAPRAPFWSEPRLDKAVSLGAVLREG